jgi:hypothetical protein
MAAELYIAINGDTVDRPVTAVFLDGAGASTVGHAWGVKCIPGGVGVCWVPDVVATSCDDC